MINYDSEANILGPDASGGIVTVEFLGLGLMPVLEFWPLNLRVMDRACCRSS